MQHIKKIYLYLVSVIALVIMVIGGIILLNMALKTWVFTKADNDYYYDTYRCSQPAVTSGEDKAMAEPKCTAEEEAKMKQEQEERKTAQKQRDAAQATAMILVATPVWYFHWRLAKREV